MCGMQEGMVVLKGNHKETDIPLLKLFYLLPEWIGKAK